MPTIKKTVEDKENELLDKIADAKNKLSKLQEKKKMEIGTLAYKHNLNTFDIGILDSAFKNLSNQLNKQKECT